MVRHVFRKAGMCQERLLKTEGAAETGKRVKTKETKAVVVIIIITVIAASTSSTYYIPGKVLSTFYELTHVIITASL